MSELYIPVGRRVVAPTEKMDIPAPKIPQKLQGDFEANPHLVEVFHTSIAKALNASLSNPETGLRIVTPAAIKDRIDALYSAFEVLRFDFKFTIRKICDLLPQKFVEALRAGKRVEDLFEATEKNSTAWAREGTQRRVELPLSELEDHTKELDTENDDEA
jgi:hypothetical protein